MLQSLLFCDSNNIHKKYSIDFVVPIRKNRKSSEKSEDQSSQVEIDAIIFLHVNYTI